MRAAILTAIKGDVMCLGIPGKIISLQESDALLRTGVVSFGGVQKEISLAYVPEAIVGDYVVVHVGFAISIIDEEEADRVFSYLEEIGELDEVH